MPAAAAAGFTVFYRINKGMAIMRVCRRCNGVLHRVGEACPKLVSWGKNDTVVERERRAVAGLLARSKKKLLETVPYCNVCGVRGVSLELDHKVPVIRGGSHSLENFQLLCRKCHQRKTNQEKTSYRKK